MFHHHCKSRSLKNTVQSHRKSSGSFPSFSNHSAIAVLQLWLEVPFFISHYFSCVLLLFSACLCPKTTPHRCALCLPGKQHQRCLSVFSLDWNMSHISHLLQVWQSCAYCPGQVPNFQFVMLFPSSSCWYQPHVRATSFVEPLNLSQQ